MSRNPSNLVPCVPTYATSSEVLLARACCKFSVQVATYGVRRFGSTASVLQGEGSAGTRMPSPHCNEKTLDGNTVVVPPASEEPLKFMFAPFTFSVRTP